MHALLRCLFNELPVRFTTFTMFMIHNVSMNQNGLIYFLKTLPGVVVRDNSNVCPHNLLLKIIICSISTITFWYEFVWNVGLLGCWKKSFHCQI